MHLWLPQRVQQPQRPQPGKQLMCDTETSTVFSTQIYTITSYTSSQNQRVIMTLGSCTQQPVNLMYSWKRRSVLCFIHLCVKCSMSFMLHSDTANLIQKHFPLPSVLKSQKKNGQNFRRKPTNGTQKRRLSRPSKSCWRRRLVKSNGVNM